MLFFPEPRRHVHSVMVPILAEVAGSRVGLLCCGQGQAAAAPLGKEEWQLQRGLSALPLARSRKGGVSNAARGAGGEMRRGAGWRHSDPPGTQDFNQCFYLLDKLVTNLVQLLISS